MKAYFITGSQDLYGDDVLKQVALDSEVIAKHLDAKIDGVESVDVSFLLQKLTICAPEEKMDEIMKKAAKAIRKVEPDCKIIF